MSTLGYGMYGFNVINANGETDSLPVCRLTTLQTNNIGNVAVFSEAIDEYGMALQNQGGNAASWSAIRTPVSGLYELAADAVIVGQGGAAVFEISAYVDKSNVYDSSSGLATPGVNNPYQAAIGRYAVAAGATQNGSFRTVIFLEKDCFVTCFASTVSGTLPKWGSTTASFFSVRCISTENSGKASWQT